MKFEKTVILSIKFEKGSLHKYGQNIIKKKIKIIKYKKKNDNLFLLESFCIIKKSKNEKGKKIPIILRVEASAEVNENKKRFLKLLYFIKLK